MTKNPPENLPIKENQAEVAELDMIQMYPLDKHYFEFHQRVTIRDAVFCSMGIDPEHTWGLYIQELQDLAEMGLIEPWEHAYEFDHANYGIQHIELRNRYELLCLAVAKDPAIFDLQKERPCNAPTISMPKFLLWASKYWVAINPDLLEDAKKRLRRGGSRSLTRDEKIKIEAEKCHRIWMQHATEYMAHHVNKGETAKIEVLANYIAEKLAEDDAAYPKNKIPQAETIKTYLSKNKFDRTKE